MPGSLGEYARSWFYDAPYGFLKVVDYQPIDIARLSDQNDFKNCADVIADDVADEYRSTAATSQDAINWMPRGLYTTYGRSWLSSERHVAATKLRDMVLAIPAMDFGHFGYTSDFSQREMSFIMDRLLYAYMINGVHTPKLKLAADILIGWCYSKAMNDPEVAWDEPFMIGITQRSLTQYYKLYHRDPRIPIVLKMLADKFMASWYNTGTHQMLYNPYPYGERCNTGCQGEVTSVINGMVGATMAWVWRYTGDVTYRDYYDELIGNIWATAFYRPYSPKEWNQAFSYNGFEGDAWRRGVETPW
jgi:hypothetical protein